MSHLKMLVLGVLWLLREAAGENDYARYCARARAAGSELLSPGDFYVLKLHRKYARPCRCC